MTVMTYEDLIKRLGATEELYGTDIKGLVKTFISKSSELLYQMERQRESLEHYASLGKSINNLTPERDSMVRIDINSDLERLLNLFDELIEEHFAKEIEDGRKRMLRLPPYDKLNEAIE